MKRNKIKTTGMETNPEDLKLLLSGKITLYFDKSGNFFKQINVNPNAWKRNPDSEISLASCTEENVKLDFKPKYQVGESYEYAAGIFVKITGVKLIRLEEITEEDALRAGVAKTEKGYKHYCPEKLFPPKVLKSQEPGFPYMADARASYFTKWVAKYGILDVSFNPWICKYTFLLNTHKTLN